jgi:hypothetical protein
MTRKSAKHSQSRTVRRGCREEVLVTEVVDIVAGAEAVFILSRQSDANAWSYENRRPGLILAITASRQGHQRCVARRAPNGPIRPMSYHIPFNCETTPPPTHSLRCPTRLSYSIFGAGPESPTTQCIQPRVPQYTSCVCRLWRSTGVE